MGSKGTKKDCPGCGKSVHVAGRLVSYHPPCPVDTLDWVPQRKKYKLRRTR